MATKSGKSNTNTGVQETVDRTRVVETVVRASGMRRQQVESVLSFMEQQGFRVVVGPGNVSAQGERSNEGSQRGK